MKTKEELRKKLREAAGKPLYNGLMHIPSSEITTLLDLLDRYEAALDRIVAMQGMTLLGGADGSDSEQRAHEIGANKAFNECAEIAREARGNDHP